MKMWSLIAGRAMIRCQMQSPVGSLYPKVSLQSTVLLLLGTGAASRGKSVSDDRAMKDHGLDGSSRRRRAEQLNLIMFESRFLFRRATRGLDGRWLPATLNATVPWLFI